MRFFLGILISIGMTSAFAQVTIDNAWARPTPPNAKLAAGYLSVVNAGAADRLLGASSPAAARVEMHVTTRDGEILRMREVKELKLPAQGRLELKPAGAHLMFVEIKQAFRQGGKVPVTLKFEKAGEVKTELQVTRVAPGAEPHHKH